MGGAGWEDPLVQAETLFLFVCVPKGTSAADRREEDSRGGSSLVTLATPWPGQTQY